MQQLHPLTMREPDSIEKAFIHLMYGYGSGGSADIFYASLLCRYRRVILRDGQPIERAATGIHFGRPVLYINKDYFDRIPVELAAEIIKHEAQHITHFHILRAPEKIVKDELLQKVANFAMDAAINQYNKVLPYGEAIGEKFIDFRKYEGALPDMEWEYYYKYILENVEITKVTAAGCLSGSHDLWGKDTGTGHEPDDFVRKMIFYDMVETYRSVGTAPRGIEELIKTYLNGKISWKKYLRDWARATVRSSATHTYRKEHKLIKEFFPGKIRKPKPEIHVYVDSSGSVSDEMWAEFYAETCKIVTDFKAVVYLHQWDTVIHHSELCAGKGTYVIRHAAGGTDVSCVLEHMRRNKVHAGVIMTDGFFPRPNFTNTKLLWVLPRDGDYNGLQGRIIVMDEHTKNSKPEI